MEETPSPAVLGRSGQLCRILQMSDIAFLSTANQSGPKAPLKLLFSGSPMTSMLPSLRTFALPHLSAPQPPFYSPLPPWASQGSCSPGFHSALLTGSSFQLHLCCLPKLPICLPAFNTLSRLTPHMNVSHLDLSSDL